MEGRMPQRNTGAAGRAAVAARHALLEQPQCQLQAASTTMFYGVFPKILKETRVGAVELESDHLSTQVPCVTIDVRMVFS